MRPIDADDLKVAFKSWKAMCDHYNNTDCDDIPFSEAYDLIDNPPTVKGKPYFNVVFNKEELNKIIEERIIEPIKKRELAISVDWIPINERLPDNNMACLVSVGKFNLTQIATYSDLMGTISHKIFYQGDYGKNNFQNITEYVNAWMPLPKPYKKEKDDE